MNPASPAPPPSFSWPSGGLPWHPSSCCYPVHIARLAALAPGCHPVAVSPGALAGLLGLLHLPNGQVLQPGLELEGLGLCQSLLRLSLQPLCFLAKGCDLLQGSGISGQLPGGPLQRLPFFTGAYFVHGTQFYGNLFKIYENVIELIGAHKESLYVICTALYNRPK
jgi:hypothetical protein